MSMQNCFTLANAGSIHTGRRNLRFWCENSSHLELCFNKLNERIVRIKLTRECCTVLQLHFAEISL